MSARVRTGVLSITLAAMVVALMAIPARAVGAPVFTVTPATGENTNANITLTFTGSGLSTADGANGATLHKAGQSDIVGTSFTPGTTSATAHFNLTGAAKGTWDVRVHNSSGTGVCTACFTVTSPNPSGISASPNSAGQGATNKPVAITGANFQNGATVSFSNSGVSVASTTFVFSGEIDIVINVTSGATVGAGNITVHNPDGGSGSCAACFTINAKPTILSSAPSSVANSAPVTLTLTGTSFETTGTATLTMSGQPPIPGTNWTRNSSTSLSIDFDITDVAPGSWAINIVNGDGGPATCSCTLTVTGAAPTVTGVVPDHKPQGVTTSVAIDGTNFFKGAAASISGPGIAVNSTTWISETRVSANITIASDATVGGRDVTVTNTDGHSASCNACFSVTLPAPAISSVSPTSGHQGTTIDLTVTGSGFVNTPSSPTVTFSPSSGITVNTTTFVDSSHVAVNITISPSAPVSARDVILTNPDTQSDTCAACFDVTLPTPTVSSVSPTSGHRGTTMDVTATGTNFVNGAVGSFSGTGITVNSTTFTDSSHVTINITIDPGATLSARDVTVTNPDFQSATCAGCFTVILPAPTATSVSPNNGEAGTTITVTVTGTNFVDGVAVSFSGTGITVNTNTFIDPSHVSAKITISPSATPGARDVIVTNPDSQSATCGTCFTVTAAVTATLTAPTTLTGPMIVTFSRDVTGVTTSNLIFRVTGASSGASETLACKDVSTASTSCAGSSVRSASLTPTAHLLPGQHYTVTTNSSGASTQITDSAGAPIPTWNLAFRGNLVEQESSLAASQRWATVAASGALGGSYTTEHLAGANASYTFTSTTIRWYLVLAQNHGTAHVYIDGVSFGVVSSYHYRTTVYGAYWSPGTPLSAGTHTLLIVVDGKKGSRNGTGTFVSVDGIKVGSAATQASPTLTYHWRSVPSTTSGGRYALSDVKGASVYFSFRGTRIYWYTVFGTYDGKASVYIDGVLRGTFDTYRSTSFAGKLIFTNLTDAIHTIRIVVTGTKNASSRGTNIIVDAFVVG